MCRTLLLLLTITGFAVVALAPSRAATDSDAGALAPGDPIELQTEQVAPNRAIIQLNVWMVSLSEDVDDKLLELAHGPLTGRESTAARVKELQEKGAVKRMRHFMASTLDGEELSMQFGKRAPRVVGVNITKFGKAQTIQFDNVGTILRAIPKASDQSRVSVKMLLESSHLEPSNVVINHPTEGEPTTTSQTVQCEYEATVACPSGGAVIALVAGDESDDEQSQTIVYLAAMALD